MPMVWARGKRAPQEEHMEEAADKEGAANADGQAEGQAMLCAPANLCARVPDESPCA